MSPRQDQPGLFEREPPRLPAPPPRHLFVILGGTGDLARRKLLPALYRLMRQGLIDGRCRILAVARSTEHDDASYRRLAREALRERGVPDEGLDPWCDECVAYVGLGDGGEAAYRRLAARIAEIEAVAELPGNRVFYLALPPAAFGATLAELGEVGLHEPPSPEAWVRVVLEKPIGHDLESARQLDRGVQRWFDESQVYRIDHYLGKETVQNLLVFRFSNIVFESLWNRERVDNVQITVGEEIGVAGRAGYYDRSGALRDMVQNHLTQLLSLVAMDVPVAYDASAVRYEKIKALRSIQKIVPERDVVLGQYAAGTIGGLPVPGYHEEQGVPEGSRTETFAALRLSLDSWRWQGVPFLLRTGKRLRRRVTEIAVTFRRPPVALFESMDCETPVEPDVLVMTLQPGEGFALYFDIKKPGEPLQLEKRPLRFDYEEAFGPLPEAYETLLLDILQGDQTLFVHAEEVEAAWRLYTPLLDAGLPVEPYKAGSWGPAEADRLLAPGAERWRTR
ncbi:MAG TPA: glucose-6-phosphate dehydrogenase [Thermoanaerobaculia bacterium]|nr:glucose-6-phosphate dehydrogenase [Thermoanaerobaculia bacterium]